MPRGSTKAGSSPGNDARITGLYYVRNPEKLTRVDRQTPLTLR